MSKANEIKAKQLLQVASVRETLKHNPDLSWLFFELTTRCNLHCGHCGSQCTESGIDLAPQMISKALQGIDPEKVMIALTGGEPMLHPQFFEIAEEITKAGFRWGMTSNATLIDEKAAAKLRQVGMRTISVSLDGMEPHHDQLRGHKGAWSDAIRGIRALQKEGFSPQITTVVHRKNLADLDAVYSLLQKEGIRSWRIINVEPIGRAKKNKILLLTPSEYTSLLGYIRKLHLTSDMDVSFGCSHFVGLEHERMIRDQYFFCGAGITIASIRANGDICACLDIENRPELVQGNIYHDNFLDVWENEFSSFRADRTTLSSKCMNCPDRIICGGDSTHTWDFDQNEPMLCYKDYLIVPSKQN